MIIQSLGLTAFRLQINGASLLLSPYDEASGLKLPRMQNDIVLYSKKDPKVKKDKSFVIESAGEYEVKNIFIYGISANGQESNDKIIYLIEGEDIKLAHLNGLTQGKLTQEQLERLEGVDILLIPVGGGSSRPSRIRLAEAGVEAGSAGGADNSLNAKQAAEIISQLEPRMVIPMNYKMPGIKQKLEPLDVFKKEIGADFEETDKLKIAKKDLPEEDRVFTIIQPIK